MGSTETLSAVVVLLTAAFVWFNVKKFTYWSSRNIKGPTPWPIFGTNIYYLFNEKIELDMRWLKQYGKVYGLYDGYKPDLRVTDSELLNFILVKRFRSFTDRDSSNIHNKLQLNWLFWSRGEQALARRSLVTPLFASSKMKAMTPHMSECVNRFIKEVEKRSSQGMNNNHPKGLSTPESDEELRGVQMNKTDISSMTLDMIATNFYSLKLDTYNDKSNPFLKTAYDLAKIDLITFLLWTLTPRNIARALKINLMHPSKFEYFNLLGKKILSERRRLGSGATSKKVDLAQAFLEVQAASGGQNGKPSEGQGNDQDERSDLHKLNIKRVGTLTDAEILGQMVFLFVAGFETTSTTINFCLFELAHQPETQKLLYEELMRVFEPHLQIIKSMDKEFPSEHYADLMDLTYLEAFISETLRMYSPILGNNRLAVEPVVLSNGLELPAGASISLNTYVTQRDPDYWNEPDKFDLTRFLPENRDKIKPGSYLPFGLGNRNCLGMRFALLEVKMALAKIILNYRILPVSKEYPPKFENNVIFLLLESNNFRLSPRDL